MFRYEMIVYARNRLNNFEISTILHDVLIIHWNQRNISEYFVTISYLMLQLKKEKSSFIFE